MSKNTILVLNDDFFSYNEEQIKIYADEIHAQFVQERLVAIYDPINIDKIFSLSGQADYHKILSEVYTAFATYSIRDMKWHHFDRETFEKLQYFSTLLLLYPSTERQLVILGVIPVSYGKIKMGIYFQMTNFEDIDDKYGIVPWTTVMKTNKIFSELEEAE